MPEQSNRDIEDELAETATLAAKLKGTGEAMMEGLLSREQAIQLLVDDLGSQEEVVEREGELRSQGRMSFGREREGQEGTALWVPEEEQRD